MIPEGWKNFAIFRRDVLEPAIQEINKYTDMLVMYEPLKTDLDGNKYRRYTSIRFSWILKSEGQIEDTEKLIDSEYQKREEARIHQQSSLEHRMDELQKECDQYESVRRHKKQQAIETKNNEEVEKRIEASPYPVATSELGRDFTDKQLQFLFRAALTNLPPVRS